MPGMWVRRRGVVLGEDRRRLEREQQERSWARMKAAAARRGGWSVEVAAGGERL